MNIHATYSCYITETAKIGQKHLLENKILDNISEIHNFVTYQITFLLTCQPHTRFEFQIRPVVPGCAGHAMAHPDFGRSVNPISTRENRLCPPNYYWHTRIFRPSDGPGSYIPTCFSVSCFPTILYGILQTSHFKCIGKL